ncbi:MAG: hypothetical protein QNJ58_12030, partial [Desulfobacterales bacterium]|nr:hypothetical protein [Desulfobacterales bacterium]
SGATPVFVAQAQTKTKIPSTGTICFNFIGLNLCNLLSVYTTNIVCQTLFERITRLKFIQLLWLLVDNRYCTVMTTDGLGLPDHIACDRPIKTRLL